jgi:hypothetical protein
VTDRAAGDRPGELEAQVAAVEVARARFGQSLETLQTEARTQVGATVERMLWKVAAAGTAIVAGLTTRKLMDTAWRAARKHDPPRHPEAPGVGWAGAIAWTVATGVGVAVARLVAERGAVAGWRRATGKLPPGVAERL